MRDLFQSPHGGKSLWPHQVRAIEMLRASLKNDNKRVVVQMPTGAGKTLTSAKIIEMALTKGNRVIFTAPMVSLINQTVEAFEAEGISGIGVIQADHPRTDRNASVQVASVQTLARRDIPNASIVIVDECHVRNAVIEAMMDKLPTVTFVGLSATPWATGMGNRWQDLVVPVTIRDLIEAGRLSRFTVYAPDVPDLRGVKVSKGDYAEAGLEAVMGGESLMASMVETWLEKGENRPTLAFGCSRAHAGAMADDFARAGVSTAYVDGRTDVIERERIKRRFVEGDVRIICSVRTMTTGVDLPVSCIVDCAPTKSDMLHVQKIGRGLRVNPGTEDCVILDHAGNSLRLGLVDQIHYEGLDKTKPGQKREKAEPKEKLPTPCVKCDVLFFGLTCPNCGHERKIIHRVAHAEGELVDVTGIAKAPTKEVKQEFWSMALWLANERKRPKLALGLYKGRFGVWPRGLEDIPKAPDQAFLNYEKSRRIAYAKKMEAQRGAAA